RWRLRPPDALARRAGDGLQSRRGSGSARYHGALRRTQERPARGQRRIRIMPRWTGIRGAGSDGFAGAALAARGVFGALLLFAVAAAAASPLGSLAGSMNPGEWKQLTTTNIAAVSQALGSYPGYDDNQPAWNSKQRKWYMETATSPDL